MSCTKANEQYRVTEHVAPYINVVYYEAATSLVSVSCYWLDNNLQLTGRNNDNDMRIMICI